MNLFQVDAFTSQPFSGNPAAVCLLKEAMPAEWMQSVAREMNLSETAFVLPEPGCAFHLRWFTPAVEVDLCGHATLATAHTLWEQGLLAVGEEAIFDTLSGRLSTRRSADGWITLDFPARPLAAAEPPAGLLEALGVRTVRFVGRFRQDYVVEMADEAELRALAPDFAALLKLPVRDALVTCRAQTEGFDFVSRVFAASQGVNEDPVTGSAHCLLTPYWSMLLNKQEMLAYQASARGGVLRVGWQAERVLISGQAVTVLQGTLTC